MAPLPLRPGSLSGINKYSFHLNKKQHETKKILSRQKWYLHTRNARKSKYNKARIIVKGPLEEYSLDTLFVTNYAKENSNYKYIIMMIDNFSRKLITAPVKNLKAETVSQVLIKVFKQLPVLPARMCVDRGVEFSKFLIILHELGININHPYSTQFKCSIVERVNRTFKSLMHRFMIKNNTKNWLQFLPQLTDYYNKTFHRSIGMAPSKVNESNSEYVLNKLYKNTTLPNQKEVKNSLPLHSFVKLSIFKQTFDKEVKLDRKNYSNELYIITKIHYNKSKIMYRVAQVNYPGLVLLGSLYKEDMLPLYLEHKGRAYTKLVLREVKKNHIDYSLEFEDLSITIKDSDLVQYVLT